MVFKKMFETDMLEKRSNEVFFKDVDLETMKSFLTFAYKDKLPDESFTIELLAAADKYLALRLKIICMVKLSNSLKTNNATAIWEAARLHNAEDLAQDAIAFMAVNWNV